MDVLKYLASKLNEEEERLKDDMSNGAMVSKRRRHIGLLGGISPHHYLPFAIVAVSR